MAASKPQHWLITGGTGFIGQALVSELCSRGHAVTVLTRNKAKATKILGNAVVAVTSSDDIAGDSRIDVVVNLAGEPLFGGLWTKKRQQAFFDSRLGTTAGVLKLLERLDQKPAVMISGSAIGYYGMNPERGFSERDDPGGDEMARLCREWEAAAAPARALGIRLVLLRIGLVLDPSGGMLAPLSLATKLCLGTRLGSGRQWMSWITREDLVRLIFFAAEQDQLAGPLNGTAPEPVRQTAFADALAKSLGRPRWLWAPSPILRLALGKMAPLLLEGQRVLPEKALDAGFTFIASDIGDALG